LFCSASFKLSESGLFESRTFHGGDSTFSNGCHVVEVEIDEATGAVAIVRYHAVEDVGHMINPLAGRGPIARRHGARRRHALMENIVYDSSGQLVSGSFTGDFLIEHDLFPKTGFHVSGSCSCHAARRLVRARRFPPASKVHNYRSANSRSKVGRKIPQTCV
jgi:CO/xanthine dehydrogenase Mo-binding subunit